MKFHFSVLSQSQLQILPICKTDKEKEWRMRASLLPSLTNAVWVWSLGAAVICSDWHVILIQSCFSLAHCPASPANLPLLSPVCLAASSLSRLAVPFTVFHSCSSICQSSYFPSASFRNKLIITFVFVWKELFLLNDTPPKKQKKKSHPTDNKKTLNICHLWNKWTFSWWFYSTKSTCFLKLGVHRKV